MAYGYYKTVTGASAQCGTGGALANFPITIFRTDADYATVANGGKCQNASGFDRGYFSDSALTTALFYEHVSYNGVSGQYEDHVNCGTGASEVTSTADWTLYSALGDSGISTDGSSTSTWDSNFKGVWHLPNGSSLSGADSTSNVNTATVSGATAASGILDGGASCVGDGQSLHAASSTSLNITGALTMSAWGKPAVSNIFQTIVSRNGGDNTNGGRAYSMFFSGAGTGDLFVSVGGNNSGGGGNIAISPGYTVNAWNHVVVTWDGTTVRAYINGAAAGTGTGANPATGTLETDIGEELNGHNPSNAVYDEVRISATARSASWILAEYNNQKSGSTFLSFGALTPVGGAATLFRRNLTSRTGSRQRRLPRAPSPHDPVLKAA